MANRRMRDWLPAAVAGAALLIGIAVPVSIQTARSASSVAVPESAWIPGIGESEGCEIAINEDDGYDAALAAGLPAEVDEAGWTGFIDPGQNLTADPTPCEELEWDGIALDSDAVVLSPEERAAQLGGPYDPEVKNFALDGYDGRLAVDTSKLAAGSTVKFVLTGSECMTSLQQPILTAPEVSVVPLYHADNTGTCVVQPKSATWAVTITAPDGTVQTASFRAEVSIKSNATLGFDWPGYVIARCSGAGTLTCDADTLTGGTLAGWNRTTGINRVVFNAMLPPKDSGAWLRMHLTFNGKSLPPGGTLQLTRKAANCVRDEQDLTTVLPAGYAPPAFMMRFVEWNFLGHCSDSTQWATWVMTLTLPGGQKLSGTIELYAQPSNYGSFQNGEFQAKCWNDGALRCGQWSVFAPDADTRLWGFWLGDMKTVGDQQRPTGASYNGDGTRNIDVTFWPAPSLPQLPAASFCAQEGQTCRNTTGSAVDVLFGVDDRLGVKQNVPAGGSIGCTKSDLGLADPAPGTWKNCFVLPVTDSGGTLPEEPGSFKCADEGGVCQNISGVDVDVAFGLSGSLVWGQLDPGEVAPCTVRWFNRGDPAPSRPKACYIVP